jgi:hypothetical protein
MSGGISASGLAMAGAAGFSAISSSARGRQEQDYYNNQAAGAAVDAETARQAAAVEAKKIRQAGRGVSKSATAALAASGVDVTQGTALDIPMSIDANAEEDAQMALLSGKYRGQRLNEQANNLRAAGENAKSAGNAAAVGSLFSSAGSLATKQGWIKATGKIGG